MPHRFLISDPFLEEAGLPERTDSFLLSLEKEFARPVFDEICVLKRVGGDYRLAYRHCARKTPCELEEEAEEVSKHLEHLIESLIRSRLLADEEGAFDLKREGRAFDAMVRLGDYFFAFNNSRHSVSALEESYGVSRGAVIRRIREYVAPYKASVACALK